MKTLVFDQSTNLTGYALFSGCDLARWGVIDHHNEAKTEQRVDIMCDEIQQIIKKVKPDYVIIEDVALRTSVKVLIMLTRLQGRISQIAKDSKAKFIIYAPTTWRRLCGINQKNGAKSIAREELKREAIKFVKNAYGIIVSDDCAEAICMGIAHLKNSGFLPDDSKLKRSRKPRNSDYKEIEI